eukprot:scaffold219875_cov42-Prasinocladus_malaysianus.AAC.2
MAATSRRCSRKPAVRRGLWDCWESTRCCRSPRCFECDNWERSWCRWRACPGMMGRRSLGSLPGSLRIRSLRHHWDCRRVGSGDGRQASCPCSLRYRMGQGEAGRTICRTCLDGKMR